MDHKSAPEETAPHRHAPLALWRIAQGFLNVLYATFGAPEEVAARHTLTRHAHALMASWLRAAEMLMRRLLLIEAAAYPKPNIRPLLYEKRVRMRKLMGFSPDEPGKWRVSFRCFSAPSGVTHTQTQKACDVRKASAVGVCHPRRRRISREDRWSYENFKPATLRSAWPLAERFEALIRVFNDPTKYAQRLARRLRTTPHRVVEVLNYTEDSWDRVGREHRGELEAEVRQAIKTLNSS
jgi:hypothetical protein